MADRRSAAIFGKVFRLLARDPSEDHKVLARDVWQASRHYDFSAYQMGCTDELAVLGLAHRGVDPEYPEDGETWIFDGEAP